MINGILRILATGCPWRDLPERYGPWQTCYHRFNRWAKDGTWDRLYQALLARMEQRRAIDWERWCVDGTSIRALHAAAGARKRGDPLPNRLTTLWADLGVGGARSSTSRRDSAETVTTGIDIDRLPRRRPQDPSAPARRRERADAGAPTPCTVRSDRLPSLGERVQVCRPRPPARNNQ